MGQELDSLADLVFLPLLASVINLLGHTDKPGNRFHLASPPRLLLLQLASEPPSTTSALPSSCSAV